MRCELNYSAHTVSSYGIDIKQFANYLTSDKIEQFDPMTVCPSDIRDWVLHLADKHISHQSIRRKVSSLSTFFRYLMKNYGLAANPASEVQLARAPHKLPVFIREAEMANIIDTSFSDRPQTDAAEATADDFIEARNDLIILTFYTTGIRRAELISLTDVNVDTARGELKVLGKRNKERIIPFGQELAQAIDVYRQIRRQVTGIAATEAFFVRPDGSPLYPMLVERVVKQALTGQTHATRLSPHTLRHSFASDMLNHGADITSVQQLLGHKSLATTQVYTHITFRDLQSNYQLAHPRAQKQPR